MTFEKMFKYLKQKVRSPTLLKFISSLFVACARKKIILSHIMLHAQLSFHRYRSRKSQLERYQIIFVK